MALDIADRAHFGKVLSFAARHGHLADLDAKLTWLDTYHSRTRTRCVMSPAARPHDIEFVMFQRAGARWRPAFTGRLHYDRPGSGTAPAFTVVLTATRQARTRMRMTT